MATSRLIRWIPRLVLGAAALHVLAGLANTEAFTAIASAGFVDTLIGHDDRGAAFWFVSTGLVLIALGELARWAARQVGRLPARLGWWLIGVAVPVMVVMPVSGAPLYAAIGALTVAAARGRPSPVAAAR
ncbi:MAG TPA: DUF6463 family protein [Pilimelia sp.]|nr:DUF6463 family protein [Pilimelia sp.]